MLYLYHRRVNVHGRTARRRSHTTFCFVIMTFVCVAPLLVVAQQSKDACSVLPPANVPEQDRPAVADVRAAGVPVGVAPVYMLSPGTKPFQTRCSAIDLYYGNEPDRLNKARSCVLAQLGLFRTDVPPPQAKDVQSLAAGGATAPDNIDSSDGLVLAMLYGNGEGVERNLPLARQFICRYSDGIASASPAEHLQEFDKLMAAGGRFAVCTEDGSSFGRSADYVCLGIHLAKTAKDIEAQEAAAVAASQPALTPSLLALEKAWQGFYSSYSIMDVTICDEGTGCGPITEKDALDVSRAWLDVLKAVHTGHPPAAGVNAASFRELYQQLNQQYRKKLAQFKTGCEGCTESIHQADRDWLVYRDAWVQYGSLRWPAIPAGQWRAWQTALWLDLLP